MPWAHPVGAEQVEGIAHAGDVGHRVQSPHLVVVDVPHRAAVGLGLRLSDGVVYPPGIGLHLLRQIQSVDDLRDVAGGGVVVMVVFMLMVMIMVMIVMMLVVMVVVMVMMMLVVMVVVMVMMMLVVVIVVMIVMMLQFLLAVDGDLHMGAGNAAGGTLYRLQPDAWQTQAVHGVEEALLVLQQLVQGGHEHIPRRPHMTFNIKRFHCNPSI